MRNQVDIEVERAKQNVAEYESVVHVLWECPAYSSCREAFKAKVKELIGDSFELLSDLDKTAYVLGSGLWEENFEDTLRLVKEFIVDVWEVRNQKLYGEDTCPKKSSSVSDLGWRCRACHWGWRAQG